MKRIAVTTLAFCLLALTVAVRADERPTDPNLVILAADCHVDSGLARGKYDTQGNFRKFIADVLAMDPRPAAVFFPGDLVERGDLESYQVFRKLAEPLDLAKIPYYFVLGNHDRAATFFEVFPEWKSRTEATGTLAYRVNLERADFLIFESTNPGGRGGYDGHIPPKIRDWLQSEIARTPDRPIFIMAHHSLDTQEFFPELKDMPNYVAWLNGHWHQYAIRRTEDGLMAYLIPSAGFVEGERPVVGYVRMELKPASFSLELVNHDRTHPRNGETLVGKMYAPEIPDAPAPEPTLVREWTFDTPGDRDVWTGAAQLKDVTVTDGVLRGVVTGHDSFISTSGEWEFPARPWNVFKARVRFLYDGVLPTKAGELFYANDHSGPYGGYAQAKTARWTCGDANEWKEVEIFPFWNNQGKIIKLRFDFPTFPPEMHNQVRVEIDWIKILDLKLETLSETALRWNVNRDADTSWESPMFNVKTEDTGSWLSLEAQGNGQLLEISWMDDRGAFHSMTTPMKRDAQPRVYNVNLANRKYWTGTVHQLRLRVLRDLDAVSGEGSLPIVLKKVSINAEPLGPPCVEPMFTGVEDAIVRVGYQSALFLDLVNAGGRDTGALQLANVKLPHGIQTGDWPVLEPLKKAERRRILLPITTTAEVEGEISFDILSADGTDAQNVIAPVSVAIPITVQPSLNLPKAAYVPEPKPVKSAYEIGALYFPGWYQGHSWERIWTRCPDRLPLLGWYNESSPEVIDWQIKWSVENGIQFYLVDWYWNRGNRSLEHWVKGFQQAKYRKYLKWAMMWANHNGPGSHSLEDQANVTKYWLENYFNTPEYYCIDGKPVVMIWSPEGMDRDMIALEKQNGRELKRGEGVKMLLDLSQKMARDAGFQGICFIAMKWPEASTRAQDIQWLADAGFDMTSIYHFMDDGGKAKTRKRFSFDLVVDATKPYWEKRHETGVIPFLPNLATGWDDRPWQDHCWIHDRTPEKFGQICRLFREFSQESGIQRAVLAPVNEWGEGSYAEPCREFGFGMYEAIRENLCEKPEEGWPLNFGPKDVGLGPYEYTEGAKY